VLCSALLLQIRSSPIPPSPVALRWLSCCLEMVVVAFVVRGGMEGLRNNSDDAIASLFHVQGAVGFVSRSVVFLVADAHAIASYALHAIAMTTMVITLAHPFATACKPTSATSIARHRIVERWLECE